jgi:DNA-directed RNA polymerase subunit K/omega
MDNTPLEALLPKAGFSIYKLVRMASNRAIELADGKVNLINAPKTMKTSTVAFEEIRQGKVVSKDVAEQFRPTAIVPQESASPAEEDAAATE